MIFILLFGLSSSSSVFLDGKIQCHDDFKGDSICDPACMKIESNFDSAKLLKNPVDMMLRSDCYNDCTSSGCSLDLLNNDICDDECNNIFCGWDAGQCGYCNTNCTLDMLNNNYPDDECNTKYCLYDNGQFGYCAPGCFYSDFISSDINLACNVSDCYYQNLTGLYNYIPGSCNQVLLENGICDDVCDNEEFEYDNGDCLCAPGCLPEMIEYGNCSLDNPCANENCNFVGGKCLKCDDACFVSYIGDGSCQIGCNTEKCNYDGGDCGCAPGCNSTYKNGEWNMVGECELGCLVQSCLFNYKVCNDLELLSVALIYSFVFEGYNTPLEIKDEENCSLDTLKSFSKDDNFSTTSFCYNEDCLYCAGFVKNTVTDCERYGDDRCFLYNSSSYFTIFGYPINIIHPVKNFSTTVPKINELMNGLIYFVKEGSFSKLSPNIITVSEKLSFYEAMYISFSPYSTIQLGEGTFSLNFTYNTYIYLDYLDDFSSPLYIDFGYQFYELTIEGMGIENTIVEFKDNIVIEVVYKTFYLQNINFTGALLLDKNCESPTCYYCPYYSITNSKVWINDRDEVIEDSSKYATNCGKGFKTQFLFENDAYISNVVFHNFQNQAPNLINSKGILSFKNVIFDKIQQEPSSPTIIQTCTFSSCFYKTLTFENVEVLDLNYGYEHIEATQQSYFLKTSQIGDILFKNVTFKYIMSISCFDCTSAAVLIFENVQGAIQIFDSEFKNIYINKLIEIKTDSLVYSSEAMAQVDKSKQKIYSMNHLFINNTKFYSIYAQEGLMTHNMKNTKQNIKISYCQFKEINSLNIALFKLEAESLINEIEAYGIDSYIILEKGRSLINIPPRNIIFFELDIEDIQTGYTIFETNLMPNVRFEEIRIKNLKKISDYDAYYYVITKFLEGRKYLSIRPEISSRATLEFQSLLNLFLTNSITLSGLSVINIESQFYSFSLIYSEYSYLLFEIINLFISNLNCNSFSGGILNFVNIKNLVASNLYFDNISNGFFSILNLMNILNLSVANASLSNINTNLKAAITLSNNQKVLLTNFKAINIRSNASKGTLFDIFLGPFPDELQISNIYITNCNNKIGRGLLFFLDTINPTSQLNLIINNVIITDSKIKNGFIYFDFNVNLNYSNIFNLKIINCFSNESIIVDNHNQGILFFDNLKINNCKAAVCGIEGNYILSELFLEIFNSEIKNCECSGNVFFIDGDGYPKFLAQNLTIFNTSSGDSPIILAINSKLILKNVHFQSLIGESLIYSLYSKTEIFDSVFEDIFSKGFILLISDIICSNCVFKKIYSTVLHLSQSSSCYVYNSLFQEIDSEEQNFLYSSKSNELIFFNCNFRDSISNKTNFYVEASYMKLISCTIKDNKSFENTLIFISYSTLLINDSIFFNQHYKFIEGIGSGDLNISNSKFFQNITNIVEITGNLTTNRLAIDDISSESTNSGIKLTSMELIIWNSSFNDFFSTVIYSLFTDVYIFNSTFIGCANSKSLNGIIHSIYGGFFKVSNSYFNSSFTETSFINVQEFDVVQILNSNFENNANDNGSGLYLKGSGSSSNIAYISLCYFYKNNVSGNGGGIYSSEMNLIIISSTFEFNRAEKRGGGIYFEAGGCKSCKLIFYGNNSFISNSSPNGSGGAIKWLGTPPEIKGYNYYLNNSALYGSDNAAYPVKLKFDTKRVLFGIDNFKPGATYKETLKICLADDYNNIVNSPEFDATEGLLINGDFIVSGEISFTATSGCFDLTNFTVSGKIGTVGYISFICKYIEDTFNNYGLLYSQENSTINILITLRNCSFGEQKLKTQCTSCKTTKYLIYPADSCLDCPTGADCLGGYLVLPKKGYWKLDKYSDEIYKCPVEEACLGSKNISHNFNDFFSIDDESTDYTGTCLTGYNGNLCGTCEFGYSKSSNGKCSKCPNPTVNSLIIALFFILIVFIAYIMVTSTLKSAFSVKSLHSVYIKIFTNYLQIIFLTTEFNMNWPSYVLELFSVQRSAASASDQLYSIDCYFNEGSNNSTEDIYSYKILLAVLLPLIISFISLFIWLFISFYKENYNYLKQEVWTTMIVLFFLIHPNIVKTIFSSFSCMEIKRSGYWLNENLGIRCWSSFHTKIILTISLPGVILWVICVPLIILVIMFKRYRFLAKDKNKVIFGFIFNGYKRSRFYWEFVILYRKILIISISVFMVGTSIAVQCLTVILLLFAALYFQYSKHPYTHKQLNLMEIQALFTATITIYCGLYYITDGLDDIVKTGLFIVIILGNMYFIIFWFYYMFKAIVDILVKLFPIVKKYLKRGDYFDKEIFQENLQMSGVYIDKGESTKNFTLFKPVLSKLEKKLDGVKDMQDLYLANIKSKSEKNDFSFDQFTIS